MQFVDEVTKAERVVPSVEGEGEEGGDGDGDGGGGGGGGYRDVLVPEGRRGSKLNS